MTTRSPLHDARVQQQLSQALLYRAELQHVCTRAPAGAYESHIVQAIAQAVYTAEQALAPVLDCGQDPAQDLPSGQLTVPDALMALDQALQQLSAVRAAVKALEAKAAQGIATAVVLASHAAAAPLQAAPYLRPLVQPGLLLLMQHAVTWVVAGRLPPRQLASSPEGCRPGAAQWQLSGLADSPSPTRTSPDDGALQFFITRNPWCPPAAKAHASGDIAYWQWVQGCQLAAGAVPTAVIPLDWAAALLRIGHTAAALSQMQSSAPPEHRWADWVHAGAGEADTDAQATRPVINPAQATAIARVFAALARAPAWNPVLAHAALKPVDDVLQVQLLSRMSAPHLLPAALLALRSFVLHGDGALANCMCDAGADSLAHGGARGSVWSAMAAQAALPAVDVQCGEQSLAIAQPVHDVQALHWAARMRAAWAYAVQLVGVTGSHAARLCEPEVSPGALSIYFALRDGQRAGQEGAPLLSQLQLAPGHWTARPAHQLAAVRSLLALHSSQPTCGADVPASMAALREVGLPVHGVAVALRAAQATSSGALWTCRFQCPRPVPGSDPMAFTAIWSGHVAGSGAGAVLCSAPQDEDQLLAWAPCLAARCTVRIGEELATCQVRVQLLCAAVDPRTGQRSVQVVSQGEPVACRLQSEALHVAVQLGCIPRALGRPASLYASVACGSAVSEPPTTTHCTHAAVLSALMPVIGLRCRVWPACSTHAAPGAVLLACQTGVPRGVDAGPAACTLACQPIWPCQVVLPMRARVALSDVCRVLWEVQFARSELRGAWSSLRCQPRTPRRWALLCARVRHVLDTLHAHLQCDVADVHAAALAAALDIAPAARDMEHSITKFAALVGTHAMLHNDAVLAAVTALCNTAHTLAAMASPAAPLQAAALRDADETLRTNTGFLLAMVRASAKDDASVHASTHEAFLTRLDFNGWLASTKAMVPLQ